MVKEKSKRTVFLAIIILCAVFNLLNFLINDFHYLYLLQFLLAFCFFASILKNNKKMIKVIAVLLFSANFLYYFYLTLNLFISKNYSILIATYLSLCLINFIFAFLSIKKHSKNQSATFKILFYIFLCVFFLSSEYFSFIIALFSSNLFEIFYPIFFLIKALFYLLVSEQYFQKN